MLKLSCDFLCFLSSHPISHQDGLDCEAEIVGDSMAGGDSPRASDVELVSSSEAWELVPPKQEVKAEVETMVDDLATSLQSVNIVKDDIDFSPDPPKEAEGATTSNQQPSEPKEPDVSPATDNPPAAEPMTAADPPPTDDAAASQATDYIPPSKRVTSLSTNQPLEPLEASDGDAAAPTAIKPTSKAAAIGKVSKRKRDFLVPGGGPTSSDEMPPPTLEVFLCGARPKSKPAPKTSKNDQKARDESPSKKASNKMPSGLDVALQKGQFSSGPIKPLPKVSSDALMPMPSDGRKKPMSVLPMASPPSEDWKDRSIASFLTRMGVCANLGSGMDESSRRCLFPRSSRIDASSSIGFLRPSLGFQLRIPLVLLGMPAEPGRSQTFGFFPLQIMLAQRCTTAVPLVGHTCQAVPLGLAEGSGILPCHPQGAGDFPPGLCFGRVATAVDHLRAGRNPKRIAAEVERS